MRQPTTNRRMSQPWSYRQNVWVRYLITIMSAILAAAIGTVAHRMGAAHNIPYGLILGFLLIGFAAWCARSRDGIFGFAAFMIFSTITVWAMSGKGPGGDIAIPVGFQSSTLPWICQHCGMIWLVGVTVLEIIMLFMPSRWFGIPQDSSQHQTEPMRISEKSRS